MDTIQSLFRSSNSENNVTAQVFAPLVHSQAGRSVLGRWLSGEADAVVEVATLFWYPLRDAIANDYYAGKMSADERWPGYATLFAALGLAPERSAAMPSGHPKSATWRRNRESPEVEVVAELASSEFDAAFVVAVGGGRSLYLLESKWLSGLGSAARIGRAGFALNQVQRGVALAAWLRKLYPDLTVTYVLCAVAAHGMQPGEEMTRVAPYARAHILAGVSPSAPHRALVEHLHQVLQSGEVRTLERSWQSLAAALEAEAALEPVVNFLEQHGRGRRYRGRSAALILETGVAAAAPPRLSLADLDADAVAEAVRIQAQQFRTRAVSCHPLMRQAHAALAEAKQYHALVGSYLARHQAELGIKPGQNDGHPDGACWTRIADETPTIPSNLSV